MENQNVKINKGLLLIIVILLIIIFYLFTKKADAPIIIDNGVKQQVNTEILGNKDDLVSFSIMPNTKVHGVVTYRGMVKGGYFFEANILINVLDSNKNVLLKSNAMAKGDWMTINPVEFEGNIDFSNLAPGKAYIEIHNDNASGLPENDKSILIPIIIE